MVRIHLRASNAILRRVAFEQLKKFGLTSAITPHPQGSDDKTQAVVSKKCHPLTKRIHKMAAFTPPDIVGLWAKRI